MSPKDCDEVVLENGILSGSKLETHFPPGGLGWYILNACDTYSKNIHQSCPYENRSMTFGEFKIRSLNLAGNMQKMYGIEKGDIVMTCMKNSLENALPVAATFYLAATIASVDPTLSVRDYEHLINLVKPKMIFLDEDSFPTISIALTNINFQTQFVTNSSQNINLAGSINMSLLIETTAFHFRPTFVTEEDDSTAVILFSSGTTGLPKGICLTHKAVHQGGINFLTSLNNPQMYMYVTTFYWISGLLMFVGQFLRGSTRIALRQFDIEFICQIIDTYKVQSAFLASSYMSKLLQMKNYSDKYNVTSLKNIGLGGSISSKEQIEKLHRTFPEITFTNMYGMTEIGGPVTSFLGKRRGAFADFPESVGTVIPGCTIKIVDLETGKTTKANEKGEIRIKAEFGMTQYHNNTTDQPFDAEGYIKTGDVGYYDEHNYLYISGRIKDMFKYQSWHIVPASIEAIIKEHPAIDEAIVFGVPHDVDGFHPGAVIKLNEQYVNDTQPEDIADFVAERVADRQRLRGGVFIVTEMATTPTGKVQKMKVIEEVMQSID